ncbi:hypothetical protein Tco_0896572 [Tanacetum coccineum]
METQKPLLKDEDGEEVDVHMYRSMIGSLMYLTSSRPDIMFAVCAYARYQVNPKVSHLHAMKRIFRYLKGQPKLGLWYPKDSPFDLVAYTDSDYAGASLDRKSTTGGKAKKSVKLMMEKLFRMELELMLSEKLSRGKYNYKLLDGKKKIIITESTMRRDLQLEDAEGVDCLPNATIFEQLTLMGSKTTTWNKFSSTMASAIICLATNQKFNFSKYIFESMVKNLDNVGKFLMYPRNTIRVGKGFSGRETPLFQTIVVARQADKAVYKELDDSLVRAVTTASSLKAEQDNGGGPRRQETMGDIIAQTRFENVSKLSNDPLFARGNTLRSGEDSLKLKELMELYTNLQIRVLDLEKKKTTQAEEIVTRVESFGDEKILGEDASKQGRINAIDLDEDITLVNDQDDADMFNVNTLTGDEVLAEPKVFVKDVNLTVDEVTLAQAIAVLKSVKPKVKANVVEEPSIPVSVASIKAKVPDKGKGILVEESVKLKKKYLISLDEENALKLVDLLLEEIASKLQAEFDEEERLAREKDEANVALTEEWDDIQAKVDVDYQLAQRLQAQEREEFTDEKKARLFVQFLKQRRKHFVAKREEEKRNKPPTQTQQRKIMCTYLENMEGKKPKDLKNKSFDSIQKMFDKAFKRVNTFVDFRTDLVEGSSKRVGTKMEQEVTKKQKVDDDQEIAKIKELMKIVSDEKEVAIYAIPLATKPPIIVDRKIHKEGKKNYYQIIRSDGSSKMYLVFSHMLKSFDREDFETLWKLVKAKYGSTKPMEDLDLII